MDRKEWLEKGQQLFAEAKNLLVKEDGDAQDAERRDSLMAEGRACIQRASELKEIEQAALAFQDELKKGAQPTERPQFKNAGQFLQGVSQLYDPTARNKDIVARMLGNPFEDEATDEPSWLSKAAQEHKDLLEQTGSHGGFLVPVEFRPELLGVVYEENPIRARATVIPMRRRQLQMPTLDQTGTAANATRQHGGIVASWTEEATQKAETQPAFRQINLVAHKLVCYRVAA